MPEYKFPFQNFIDFVVIFEDSLEMESVALTDILDTKVINKRAKHNEAPLVAPQARSGWALVVAVLFETFFEGNVGQGPRLWETINSVANFEENPDIGMDVVHEAVIVDELCWDVAQFDVDVLRSVQRCLKVEVFDVKGDKLGAPAGKDAFEEQLDEVEGGGIGPTGAGIFDVLACDGDASVVGV